MEWKYFPTPKILDPAVLVAMWVFGYRRHQTGAQITSQLTSAIEGISNVLLVIAAGGVMKEVIIDTGIGKTLVSFLGKLKVSPLILAWPPESLRQ